MQYSQMLNKIVLGDCLEIMKHIPDDSVDMVLCDLPYGTTAEAALRTNRQFIGIEQDEQYWKIACERIDKLRI